MSQENVEIVRANIDAFNRGDYEAALAVLDQDVEWHVPDVAALDAPASGMVRGRERVAEVFARWLGAWDPFSFEVTEILGHGEQVFLAGYRLVVVDIAASTSAFRRSTCARCATAGSS
jgi:ketosteroid isomerase-like protein